MDFRILGSLEAFREGREVALGGSKQRALLALLLVHANETLSTDRLIEELWGEGPPATAAKTVQVHVSRLRKALTAGARGSTELLVTREHGYQLVLDPEQLDARRFERLMGEGCAELADGGPERATALLEEALSLWRGNALADFAYEPFAQPEIARLEELRVSAHEAVIDAKLLLGRHTEVVVQLETLIGEHPYRERLRAQLMMALYRSERQADALQAYQAARRALVEELGIEPGARLRDLEAAILAQDPALALPVLESERAPPSLDDELSLPEREPELAPAVPTPAGPVAPPSARRLVSILFADLVGSTGLTERLDAELMHALLDRYTETCGGVIERHGGTVEGFIGDAVVGVFGLAELHEDDAVRALRAAVELREAGEGLSAELGIEIAMKFGVESGEVFVSRGARRSPFAAGDAFNVAARLEGLAKEGEILLGENVHRLAAGAVRVERLEPLSLRGRERKVQAWRLLDLNGDGAATTPSPGSDFVGRGHELDALRAAVDRVRAESTCHAVTVVGPAGIGKSRLARELIDGLGSEATVVVGRCLSYGEGVTYRPLADIVRQLGGDDPRQRINELVGDDERVARLVLGAVDLAEGPAQAEETSWAVRVLLERASQERPLVAFFEDLHWAEPTLVDLLDYLVSFSNGHPILLVCLARPEFLETRPPWLTPLPNRSLLTLEPLSDAQARELVESFCSDEELASGTAARIVETAEGNPLFIEQLVAVGAEGGDDPLPSSIQAVLAARIDRLAPQERALIEHASVQGRSFYAGAVTELMREQDEGVIAGSLVSLVRKQLIRSDRSDFPGEDAFRFAHALIREAAYQGLSKRRRAELHEGVARWLEARPQAQDETIGFHLGEAYRQLAELGSVGERERGLADAAAERLVAAADAALLRGDAPARARLLERAEAVMDPNGRAHAALLPRLGAALLEAGRLADAAGVLTDAVEHAHSDPWLRSRAQVELQLVRLQAGSADPDGESTQIANSALADLEVHGDELGQCRALSLRATHALIEGHVAAADEDWCRAADHAARAEDEPAIFEILDWRASAALFGPTPVPQAIARCREICERVSDSPVAVARTARPLAALHAMAGDFDEAYRLVRVGDDLLGELGGLDSAITQQEGLVELLAGRPAAAEARLRRGYDRLEQMGEKALLATTAAMLAGALHAQGRPDEAAEFCLVSREAATEEDLAAQVGWRGVEAKLLAERGEVDEAETIAAEAVRLAEPTDCLSLRADALLDLGTVLRQAGRDERANTAIRDALELYRAKGDLVSAKRASSRLGTPAALGGANQRTEVRDVEVR